MMRLEHKCIVRLIGISKGDMLMMVQELAPLGSMLQYIIDHSDELKVNYELKLWASQIACGKSMMQLLRFQLTIFAFCRHALSGDTAFCASGFGSTQHSVDFPAAGEDQ